MSDVRRESLHVTMERLRGQAETNRRRIMQALDNDRLVPSVPGRGYDDDRISGGQPGNPVLAFAQATQQTRTQVGQQIVRVVGDLGDSLTAIGIDLPDTHRHLNRLAMMPADAAPQATKSHIDQMLAIHAGWFQLLTDMVLRFYDDERATDEDVKLTAQRCHMEAHALKRCANRTYRLLCVPDHPNAWKHRRCACECCPQGCDDVIVSEQRRKTLSDRCLQRTRRIEKANA